MLQWWDGGRFLRDVLGARRWMLPVLVSQVRDPGLRDRVAVGTDGREAISRIRKSADTPGEEPGPIHPAVSHPPVPSRCGAATQHALWLRSGGGLPRRDSGGPGGLPRWWCLSHCVDLSPGLWMSPWLVGAYGVRSWARRRFMISCAGSASTPRSRPEELTCSDSIIPAAIAGLGTRRFPRRSLGHPRPTAAVAPSRHPQQTKPVGQSADEEHWQRCPSPGLWTGEVWSDRGETADTPNPQHPLNTPKALR
jgi:hypothetical protein